MGLAKNSALYLAATLCIRATSFFLLPFYTHLVPPEVYGQIYVVSAMNNFLTILLSLSLSVCISRFFFDCINAKQVKQLYSTILLFVFISSTSIITPFFIWGDKVAFILNIPHKYFIYGLVMSYLGVYYQVILALLYAMQRAKQVSITSMCVGVLQIVLQLCLVINMEDKAMALLSTMMIQAITTFIIFIVYSLPYMTLSFNFKGTAKYLKYSFSQLPSDVSAWLVSFTDRIFINKFVGHAGAGIYGIGANIGLIPSMIYQSINSAFMPHVNSQYKAIEVADGIDQKDELKARLSRTFLLVSSVILIIISIFTAFSRDVVNLLDPSYADAFFVVVIMLVTSLMNSYRIIYMAPLAYNIKYTKVKSIVWVVAGVLNVILNIYLIPRYGIYAACVNSLATYTLTFLLMLFFSKKAFYIKYQWDSLLKIALMSVLYCLTLSMPSSAGAITIKFGLMILYLYVCIRLILKIDLFRMVKTVLSNRIRSSYK